MKELPLPPGIMHAVRSVPNPIFFSDRSYTRHFSKVDELGQNTRNFSASAGVVIISSDEQWAILPSVGIYITLTSEYNSAFLAELAGLCLAAAIKRHVDASPILILDCQGAIKVVRSSKTVSGITGKQLIRRCRWMLRGLVTLIWHQSHPKRRGGHVCLKDHGVLLADWYASGKGYGCLHSYSYSADILDAILLPGPSLILKQHLLISDLRVSFQKQYYSAYIAQPQQDCKQLYGS